MYRCSECGFTGEGWHRWNCSKGKIKFNINPNFTPVLEHFEKLGPSTGAPEMLPVKEGD